MEPPKLKIMNHLNVKKFGLAFALTGSLFYLGCMILILTVGHANSIKFFNSILHGLDVSSIMRMDVPLLEAGIGIIETFILGWLVGACLAAFYNISMRKG
jgi:hypothetical protein